MTLRWSRCCRFLLPLVLLAALVGLVPLAHAVPPDQTWIAGSYDAADQDDAVTNALSIDGATKAHRRSVEPVCLAGDGIGSGRPEPRLDLMASHEPSKMPSDIHRIDSARSPPR